MVSIIEIEEEEEFLHISLSTCYGFIVLRIVWEFFVDFVQEGIAITDASLYRTITRDQLVDILRPDTAGSCMPLLDERLDSLHTAGTTLCEVQSLLTNYYVDCMKFVYTVAVYNS